MDVPVNFFVIWFVVISITVPMIELNSPTAVERP